MYLSERPFLRIITLCALYVAQGIPFGFVTVTLAAHLEGEGFSLIKIGYLLACLSIPWSFKWVWGPIIDSVTIPGMGKRRPWILLAQSCMMITIGVMVFNPDLISDYNSLWWMVLMLNVFASIQDVSVDALAVDLLKEQERGKANGYMYGCSYLGTFLGATVLGVIAADFGMKHALLAQLFMLALVMLFPMLLREKRGDLYWGISFRKRDREQQFELETSSDSNSNIIETFRNLIRAFSFKSTLIGALLALLVKIGVAISTIVGLQLILGDLGWARKDYTTLEGNAGLIFGLGGSILGGYLSDKYGVKRILIYSSVALGFVWAFIPTFPMLWEYTTYISVFIKVQTLLAGMISVSLFSLFMSISWPKVAATQFTAYMALLNLSTMCGNWLSGNLLSYMAWTDLMYLIGLFQALSIFIVLLIDPKEARESLGKEFVEDD
ncbi:MAG: MFS transporter [Pirellulales bacterium]